jgi:hypothetical protein
MTDVTRWASAALLALLAFSTAPLQAAEKDPLKDTKARMAVEAQRVEREFREERSAAYKLVRSDNPKLVEATEKLQTLLAMVRADNSLDTKRREQLIVTLEFDLGEVKKIAADRRRFSRAENDVARAIRSEARRIAEERRPMDRRGTVRDAESILKSRGGSVADGRSDRRKFSDGFTRVMRSVDESATPVARDVTFPRDWVEKSRRRATTQKITAKEQAILKALNTTLEVDFDKNTFEDVLEFLRKKTGVTLTVDKRAMDEVSVTYESPITLKLRGTMRTILKRILGDVNMAYVIKDEVIQITSQERAKQMTTTRTYYIGDLAGAVDLRLGPIASKLVMIQTINQLINTITQTVDPKSWQVNNPDAVGTIVFNPLQMTLTVKQTAEIHYALGGR